MARGRRSVWAPTKPKKYPGELEASIVMKDGTSAWVRPMCHSDARAIQEFHAHQSEESRFFRFFTSKAKLTTDELERLTKIDYDTKFALVAVRGERIIGVGRYTLLESGEAEIAFSIADEHQGIGLGMALFDALLGVARERGIPAFVAEVLPDNKRMLHLFDATGLGVSSEEADGVIHVRVLTAATDASRAALELRCSAAAAATASLLFSPESIMIVGASRQREHVGAQIVRGVIASGFPGAVFPVNPEAYEVNGLKSFGAIADVPGPVDLAVLALNPERCIASIDDLAVKRVKAVVVVSAGFAEAGPDGQAAQERLLVKARTYGMRVLGPASLGFFRTGESPLNVSLSPRTSERGTIALAGQSTALCAMVLAGADARGLRVREFVSAGNRIDISLNDCLERWADDESIDVIALSVESMGNPRRFTEIIRRVSHEKSVVVVRPPGNDDIGPVDRLGRESSLRSEAMDQILDSAGAIRAASVDHLLDTVSVLSREGDARGNRVGLLSNSTALGATLRAAAESSGLTVADENFHVPIVGDDRFVSRAFTSMAGPGGVDSIIVSLLDTQRVDLVHLATELSTLARGAAVQVLMVVVADEPRLRILREALRDNPSLPPVFSTPQRAAEALAATQTPIRVRHRKIRAHPSSGGHLVDSIDPQAAATVAQVIAAAKKSKGKQLKLQQKETILDAYGITRHPHRLGAAGAASVILRSVTDPVLGVVVSCSMSGDATDVFHDIAYALGPLESTAAESLVLRPRAASRLREAAPRGSDGFSELVSLVSRLSRLVAAHPDFSDVTLDPVVVNDRGVGVLNFDLTIAESVAHQDKLPRSLPAAPSGGNGR